MLTRGYRLSLGRIISRILHDLYSARKICLDERMSFAQNHKVALGSWRAALPCTLDVDGTHTSMLIPIFQRQKNVLSLAYHHAIVLTHRQLLLDLRPTMSSDATNQHQNIQVAQQEESVRECLQAATHIVGIVNGLVSSGQMLRAYWVSRSDCCAERKASDQCFPVHALLCIFSHSGHLRVRCQMLLSHAA